jgi:hypothetical protein
MKSIAPSPDTSMPFAGRSYIESRIAGSFKGEQARAVS